jgi:Leucine-rich repeat (LRR) protein
MAPSISMAPTMERHGILLDVLTNTTDTPLEVLADPETPQGRAFLWMANEDKIVFDLMNSPGQNESSLLTVPADPDVVTKPALMSNEALFHLPQRYALVTLDISVHANSEILWSFPDLHECEWPGITCDRNDEIIGINWARQDLTGYVAPEISLLTVLETLDLAQNQLTGFVDVFWNLPQLKTLYLFENRFMGSIGSEIGNMYNLESLYLGKNQLSGSIPEEIFDLDDLRKLPLPYRVALWLAVCSHTLHFLVVGYLILQHNR